MDTILIVDDEKSILDLLTMVFKKDGYRVVTNPGTAKAFELLASEDVDLVISDIKMPQLDGMAFLKAVKKQRPDVPVIVITAFGSVKQAVEALKDGALDYVTKPFDIEELKILVAHGFEQRRRAEEHRQASRSASNAPLLRQRQGCLVAGLQFPW